MKAVQEWSHGGWSRQRGGTEANTRALRWSGAGDLPASPTTNQTAQRTLHGSGGRGPVGSLYSPIVTVLDCPLCLSAAQMCPPAPPKRHHHHGGRPSHPMRSTGRLGSWAERGRCGCCAPAVNPVTQCGRIPAREQPAMGQQRSHETFQKGDSTSKQWELSRAPGSVFVPCCRHGVWTQALRKHGGRRQGPSDLLPGPPGCSHPGGTVQVGWSCNSPWIWSPHHLKSCGTSSPPL